MARFYQDDSQESSESRFVLVNNFFEELAREQLLRGVEGAGGQLKGRISWLPVFVEDVA
jgi:hypothetical protein